MNQRPVSYLQTDPRWSAKDYSARGGKTTIGASGCGPTAMAMVLATWADPQVTPATECAWALAHGYKAPARGRIMATSPGGGPVWADLPADELERPVWQPQQRPPRPGQGGDCQGATW